MRNHRMIRGVIAGASCLVIGFVLFTVARRKPHWVLPADVPHGNMPAQFNAALHQSRDRLLAVNDPGELRKLAHLYQANRFFAEARACYRLLADTSALTAHDHYYLADIAQNEGDLAGTEKELHLVLASDPQYLPAQLALAEVLVKSGQDDDARREFTAILSKVPNQPQATFGLARIELRAGHDDAAVARLVNLLAVHPEMTSGAALLAQILDRRGETGRAAALRQWSRQKPEPIPADPWLTALLADCYDVQRLGLKFEEYFTTGQLEEALPLLGRIEELDPKSPIPALLRGWSQSRNGHDRAAVEEFRQALAKGGDPEKICPYLVQSLLTLGDLPGAAQLAAEYYAKLPDSIPIITAYADVAMRQGDDKLARVLLAKLLQQQPNLYSANLNLAKILWTAGERAEAAKLLLRIAENYPNDVPSRALLAEYYLGKSDPLSALAPLESAITHATAGTPARERLVEMLDLAYLQGADLAAAGGHVTAAIAYCEKAIGLAPLDPRAYASKANFCMQLKRFAGAAEALGKMVTLQPDNPTVQLSLGDVLYQNGDSAGAEVHWRKALQLAGAGDTELRSALGLRLQGHFSADIFK